MVKIIAVEGFGNVEFPDEMSDQDIGTAIERDILKTKPAGPPTTTAGEVTEFVKGVPSGIASGVISAGRGMGTLAEGMFPETLGKPGEGFVTRNLTSGEKWVKENILPPSKGYEQSTGRSLGEGIGGFAAVVGTSFLPGGQAAALTMLAGQGADAAQQRIAQFEKETGQKVDPVYAELSRLSGAAIDSIMLLPINRAQKLLDAAIAGKLPAGVFQSFGRVANMGVMMGAPAGASSVLNDLADKVLYNPNIAVGRNFWQTVEHAAETGAIWQLGVEAVVPFARRRALGHAREQFKKDIEQARGDIREEMLDREAEPEPRFREPPTAQDTPESYAERIGQKIELFPGRYEVGEVPGKGYEILGPRNETITEPIKDGPMVQRLAQRLNEMAGQREQLADADKAVVATGVEPTPAHREAAQIAREPVKPFKSDEIGPGMGPRVNSVLRGRDLGERDQFLPGDLRDAGMKVDQVRKLLRERFQISEDITPLDVAKVASERNILIDKSFEEFAKRATGSPDALQKGNPVDLSVLKQAVERMPAFDTPTSIPIPPRPRHSERMYEAAVNAARRIANRDQTGTPTINLAQVRTAVGLRETKGGNDIARDILEKMTDRGVITPGKEMTNAQGRPHRNPVWNVYKRVEKLPFGRFELYPQDMSTGGRNIWTVMERRFAPNGGYMGNRVVKKYAGADAEAKVKAWIGKQPKPPVKHVAEPVHPKAREVLEPERRVERVADKVRARREEAEFEKKVMGLLEPVLRRTVGRDVKLEITRLAWQGAEGQYLRGAIALARDAAPPGKHLTPQDVAKHLEGVLNHENIHAMRALDLFTDAEWRALVDKAWAAWPKERQALYRNHESYRNRPDLEDILREESVADFYRAWRENPTIAAGQPATLFQRVIRFFKNLRDAIVGEKKADVQEVLANIESGKIGARQRNVVRAVETVPPKIYSRAAKIAQQRDATFEAVKSLPSNGIFGKYDPETRTGIRPDGALFSLRPKPQYSKLVEHLKKIPDEIFGPEHQAPMRSAKRWVDRLKEAGFKEEELEWTGLKDFLGHKLEKNEFISRDELIDVAQNKMVEVADVYLSGDPKPEGKLEKAYNEIVAHELDTWITDTIRHTKPEVGTPEKVPIIDASRVIIGHEYKPVLYGTDTSMRGVPNMGVTIREMIKGKRFKSEDEAADFSERLAEQVARDNVNAYLEKNGPPPAVYEASLEAFREKYGPRYERMQDIPGGQDYTELLVTIPNATTADRMYEASHHRDFPNVVAHARFRTRDLGDGSKILHVHEVQSDWHQNGRQRGYAQRHDSADYVTLTRRFEELDNRRTDIQLKIGELGSYLKADAKFLDSGLASNDQAGTIYLETRQNPQNWVFHTDFNIPGRVLAVQNITKEIQRHIGPGDAWPPRISDRRERFVKVSATDFWAENVERFKAFESWDRDYPVLEELKQIQTELLEVREKLAREAGVPDAPFKDTWQGLVMKRLIMHAVETGHTHIAWADAQTISKVRGAGIQDIRAINWYPGVGQVWVRSTERGNVQVPGEFRTRAQLEALLGRENAERVVRAEVRHDDGTVGYHAARFPEGLGLPKEFFRILYNQELPQQTNKIIKKYDSKVEEMQVPQLAAGRGAMLQAMRQAAGGYMLDHDISRSSHVSSALDMIIESWGSQNFTAQVGSAKNLGTVAEDIIRRYQGSLRTSDAETVREAVKHMRDEAHKVVSAQKVPSMGFKITPPLIDEVTTHGLPLFSLSPKEIEAIRSRITTANPVERRAVIDSDAGVAKRVMEGNKWKKQVEKGSPSGATYYKFVTGNKDFFLRVADHPWPGPRTRGEFPEIHFDWNITKPFQENLDNLRKAQKDRIRGVTPPDEGGLLSLPYVSDKASPEARKVIEEMEAGRHEPDTEFMAQYALRRPTPVPAAIEAIDWTYRKPQRTLGHRIMEALTGMHDPQGRTSLLGRMFMLDHVAPIEQMSKDAARAQGRDHLASTSSWGAMRQVGFVNGIYSRAMTHGVPVFERGYGHVTNISPIDGQPIQGLAPIFREVARKNDWETTAKYFYAIRGMRLDAEGREQVIAPADAQAVINHVRANMPWIVEAHRQYQRWNEALVKFAVDTGYLDPHMAAVWMQHSDYVPFYRQLQGQVKADGSSIGPSLGNSVVNIALPERLTGGKDLLGDFVENITRNGHSLISAALRNEAGVRSVRDAEITGIARRIPMNGTADHTVTVRFGGHARKYAIDDPLVYQALVGPEPSPHPIIQGLGWPARLLRNMVTKDPAFMAANMLRDTLSTWAAGRDYFPVASTAKGFGQALMNSGASRTIADAGVFGGVDFAGTHAAMGRKFKGEAAKDNPIRNAWRLLEHTSNASDLATRSAVYERVLRKTGDEAQAVLEAAEALNFNRHGNSKVIRALTTLIPFLNARIQGLDVLYRAASRQGTGGGMENGKDIQRKMFMRMAMLVAGTVMYYNSVSQTEQWKNINQDLRDNYYLFPMGEDRPPLAIPVPFEVGFLTKILPERILAWWDKKDTGKEFARSMASQAVNTFQFNPIPQAAKPIIEAWTNFSFFRATPIEGRSVEGLLPSERYHQGTPETMKQFSRYLAKIGIELSPARASAIVSGYTGQIGAYALMAADELLRASNVAPPGPEKRIEDYPFVRRFLRDRIPSGVVGEFYEMRNQVQQIARTSSEMIRQGRFDEAMELQQRHQKELSMSSSYNSVAQNMTRLRALRVQIMSDRSMDGATKRTLIDQIRQQELKLAEQMKDFSRAVR